MSRRLNRTAAAAELWRPRTTNRERAQTAPDPGVQGRQNVASCCGIRVCRIHPGLAGRRRQRYRHVLEQRRRRRYSVRQCLRAPLDPASSAPSSPAEHSAGKNEAAMQNTCAPIRRRRQLRSSGNDNRCRRPLTVGSQSALAPRNGKRAAADDGPPINPTAKTKRKRTIIRTSMDRRGRRHSIRHNRRPASPPPRRNRSALPRRPFRSDRS